MSRIAMLALVIASTLAVTPPTGGTPGNPLPPSEPGPPPMTGMGPVSAGAPGRPSSAAMLTRAKAAFAQLQSGNVDRTQLDDQMNAGLTDATVTAVKAAIGTIGDPQSFVEVRSGTGSGYPYAVYLVTFANGTKMNFVFAVDGRGKIAGMQLTPPQ